MPSKSAKQHRTMQWVAHSKEGARKTGIPQSVAKDFVKADQKAHKYQGHKGGKKK